MSECLETKASDEIANGLSFQLKAEEEDKF
jgi:hypothetical protein